MYLLKKVKMFLKIDSKSKLAIVALSLYGKLQIAVII